MRRLDYGPPGALWPPNGSTLILYPLGSDAYAVVTAQYFAIPTQLATTSAGIILTDDGVIVVEALVNFFLACQIVDLIEALNPPNPTIKYVAMTNHHGDHCFGTSTFHNSEITYALHAGSYEYLTGAGLEQEITLLEDILGFSRNYGIRTTGQAAVYDPALLVTNSSTSFTLGGRTIELLYFGWLQSVGDILVWDETSRSLWGGNLLSTPQGLPFLLDGGAILAVEAYARLGDWLNATGMPMTIVCGHSYPMSFNTTVDTVSISILYLQRLIEEIQAAVDAGQTLQETCVTANSTNVIGFFVPPGLHNVNVVSTYYELGGNDTQPFCF